MVALKKLGVSLICIGLILLVLLNVDKISDKLIMMLNYENSKKITRINDYYKEENYNLVKNTTSFTPYGKQDIINIFYTLINNRQNDYTIYCPSAYKNCLKDLNEISKSDTLTHINNYVHPFNSFTTIDTKIYETGEIQLKINYLYKEEEIKEIEEEVKKILQELKIDDIDNDYDKLKAIHDYIINNTKYDTKENTDNTSAYTALVNHLATCNGYTDLMAIFLSKMGYNNFKIATTKTENNKGHVWNAVYYDNSWRHIDLTWDDPVSSDGKNYLYHKYFLVTTEELITADSNITSKEHEFDYTIYSELK